MNHIKTIILGFLGGMSALFLFFYLPGSGPLVLNSIKGDLIEFVGKEPALTPTPTAVSPDFWQKIVSDNALSTVAVQSFKSSKISREGSGMIVSSDGIIITTLDVVSGADVVQIFHEDKIMRAQVVKYDGFKNLAIIKVDASNMNVARLDRNYQFQLQPGQDVVVSGKLVELSNLSLFVQKGIISRVLSRDIVLDVEPNYFLSGSKVINNSGIVVGMAYLRSGVVRLVKSEIIDDFLKNYFELL